MTPEITEPNHVMIMVKAAALDPMDVYIATGYGSFIRKFLIKHTLNVSEIICICLLLYTYQVFIVYMLKLLLENIIRVWRTTKSIIFFFFVAY